MIVSVKYLYDFTNKLILFPFMSISTSNIQLQDNNDDELQRLQEYELLQLYHNQ